MQGAPFWVGQSYEALYNEVISHLPQSIQVEPRKDHRLRALIKHQGNPAVYSLTHEQNVADELADMQAIAHFMDTYPELQVAWNNRPGGPLWNTTQIHRSIHPVPLPVHNAGAPHPVAPTWVPYAPNGEGPCGLGNALHGVRTSRMEQAQAAAAAAAGGPAVPPAMVRQLYDGLPGDDPDAFHFLGSPVRQRRR